jgi:hypothetical protein
LVYSKKKDAKKCKQYVNSKTGAAHFAKEYIRKTLAIPLFICYDAHDMDKSDDRVVLCRKTLYQRTRDGESRVGVAWGFPPGAAA